MKLQDSNEIWQLRDGYTFFEVNGIEVYICNKCITFIW